MLIADSLVKSFDKQIQNFPEEIYKFRKSDHLTKLMSVLLGDPGVGQATKIQLLARLSETLNGTRFSDLDSIYGICLRYPRLQDETYSYNPFVDALTFEDWAKVYLADGKYRSRLKLFMLALTKGTTVQGLSLAAESVVGVSCQIVEAWRYIDGGQVNSYPGRLSAYPYRKEFLVVPQLRKSSSNITPSTLRVLTNVLQQIKPADSVCSIKLEIPTYTDRVEVNIQNSQSPSEYFEMTRDVLIPQLDPKIKNTVYEFMSGSTRIEAPTLAFMSTSETVIDLAKSIIRVENPIMIQSSQSEDLWTEWRVIEKANSPDNYSNGIANDGVFSWSSQSEWEAYWSRYVLSINGEVSSSRYRLPHLASNSEIVYSEPSVLAMLPNLEIKSSWYGSI